MWILKYLLCIILLLISDKVDLKTLVTGDDISSLMLYMSAK